MRVTKSELVFDGYCKVRRDWIAYESGTTHAYEIVEPPSPIAVMILAQNSKGEFIINEEYRHPTKKWLLSCPGGTLSPQETPEECAKRELLEETGYECSSLSFIGEAFPFPGIAAQKILYFYGEGAKKVQEPELETAEQIETYLMTEETLNQKIASNVAIDGLLLTALFFSGRRFVR